MSVPTPVELAEMAAAPPASRSTRPAAWQRVRRLGWGLAAAAILLLIVAVSVFAPLVAPHDPLAVDIRHRLSPPAWMSGGAPDHLLGTDQVGRDLLSRMIYGGRVSLVVGVTAVLMSASIGVLLGLAAGYFRGNTDWTIMTGINVMLTFPFVLLALAVISVLGPSFFNMVIVLGVAGLIASVQVLLSISRIYITRLQDRIIKLEMRVRALSVLTPAQQETLARLKKAQVVALRFASDEELGVLLERAARENLQPKDIKASIKTWRPDLYRT